MNRTFPIWTIILTASVLLSAVLAPSARAQSTRAIEEDDPVSKAMKSVEASIDASVSAAERELAASKIVKESAAARDNGARAPAMEKLKVDGILRAFPQSVIKRFNGYKEAMARILEEESVPAELLSVAFVESGFNPTALSPKGARGIWQFMPATARRYGLEVRPNEDHRTDPEHSTRAAAKYLRDLYEQFGDWRLALAAYNAGETRVQKIIDATGIRDFSEMARRGYLPSETRNYVPAVISVWRLLEKH